MVFDGCKKNLSGSFFHFIFYRFGENFSKRRWGFLDRHKRKRRKVKMKKYIFKQKVWIFILLTRRIQELFWFFLCFPLFGRSSRRQTGKMTVWEISFNPRKFLRFFSPSVCPFLNSFMYFFTVFFRGKNEEFLLKIITSPLHRLKSAFFMSISSLSHFRLDCPLSKAQHKSKHTKIHSLISQHSVLFFAISLQLLSLILFRMVGKH